MILYCTATGLTDIISCSINDSHDASNAVATIECVSHSVELGDEISIDVGYSTNHAVRFTGYVKIIERRVPSNTYTITAYDAMARAIDFFIASNDPNNALTYQNISAEDLVENLMALAGLTSFTSDPTYFTFGVNDKFEVNLTSPYDYSNTVADLLTWHLWADSSGTIHFENRKPFIMTGDTSQPGDTTDERAVATSYTVDDSAQNLTYGESEKNLRNRIVVYGNEGVFGEASAVSPYLPAGFYKSAVLAAPGLIDTNAIAQTTAEYNLNLLNRLDYYVVASVQGDSSLAARQIVKVNSSLLGITNTNYYVYGCTHDWSKGGYTTTLELRK